MEDISNDMEKDVPETNAEETKQSVHGTHGKELTEEELLRRRKFVVIPGFVLIFMAVLYWIFAPSSDRDEIKIESAGLNVNVPEPETVNLEGNKADAYERLYAEREKENRMGSLSDLAERLLEGRKETDPATVPAGNMQQSADTYEQLTKQLESFYDTPEGTADDDLSRKVDELSRRLEMAEADRSRAESREEMMERSYRMAARYLNPKTKDGTEAVEKEEESVLAVPVSRVETETASSLERPLPDSIHAESLSVERNYGFNTAVGSGYGMGTNTISACISESQTIEQGGRVKLRLLEPLQAGNITIPVNSMVTGTANIQGERLDILVSSIEYAGNIIPVELAIYDIDGQRGIFVPGSEGRTAAKEVMGDVSQSMGNSISFAGSAGQQVAMDLTRGILQGGTRFISQRVKAVKIKLKAGYRVLLVAKKQ
ncbi:conjugative transposon protein TraM [Phocaeicola coprophilus]|uniref:conjugative transposon protein TraM n=1 Tax=Phocaeicola coprophilus TaxID=387090 RepID=UPI0039962A2E